MAMVKMGEGGYAGLALVLVVVMAAAVIQGVRSEAKSELEDCIPELMTLQTCLQFVSGKAPMPTPNCCQGLDKLVNTQPKCLCILIKDHDSPLLDSFNINLKYAAKLPTKCNNAKADINKCPALLGLNPNSTNAKIFKDLAGNTTHTGNNAPSTLISNPVGSPPKSNNAMLQTHNGGRWFVFEFLCGISIWVYNFSSFLF